MFLKILIDGNIVSWYIYSLVYRISCSIVQWFELCTQLVCSGDQYVIESDGLLIKDVTKKNAGTFTCRARVPQTGELEERDIRLDVQEPPSWIIKPSDLRGAELDKVEFKCEALGSPPPKYTWVDKDGLDATEKEGMESLSLTLWGLLRVSQKWGFFLVLGQPWEKPGNTGKTSWL